MNDPPTGTGGDGGGSRGIMIPQEMAIQLLQSKDAKIAAAAARVFSPRSRTAGGGGSPILAAQAAMAQASQPSPTASLPPAAASHPSDMHSMRSVKRKMSTSSSPPAEVCVDMGDTNDDSSAAASALKAMALASTMTAADTETTSSTASATEAAAPRVPGKKFSSTERLQRSRERNRMHARKTRQRKKEHMSALQDRCAKLKAEQLCLRQSINEKNTASILLGMFGKSSSAADDNDASATSASAKVDALLKRNPEDIPDASKIPELPALILPGQHSSKKIREAASAAVVAAVSGDEGDATAPAVAAPAPAPVAVPEAKPLHPACNAQGHLPDDGIDYELLSKDRSKCTPAELDQIRRERNRMHAKRTRDRKRIFMEEMEVMIKQLEEENQALQEHLDSLNANGDGSVVSSAPISTDTTPSLGPSSPRMDPSASATPILSGPVMLEDNHQQEVTLTLASLKSSSNGNSKKRPLPVPSSDVPKQSPEAPRSSADTNTSGGAITVDQIKNILQTAGELDKNSAIAGMLSISSSVASNASPVSIQNSDDEGEQREEESGDDRSSKRQRIEPSSSAPVPASC